MLRSCLTHRSASVSIALCLALGACHAGDDDSNPSGSSGSPSTGGTSGGAGGTETSSGGTGTGGASATGGSSTGGSTATGGSSTGGSTATGGTSTGGTSTGGSAGAATGGSATGGTAGAATGGSAGTSGSGGSAGTSSPGGAGGASGSAGTGANPCDTALFCDDFESYTTALSGKWAPHTTSGAVAIDQSQHVSGKQSVKFTTQSAGSATAFMRITDASIFPVPSNVLYGRMLFRVESEPTQSVHWTIIAGLGVVPGQTYHAEYRYGGQMPITQNNMFAGSQLMANYDTPDWYSNKNTPGSDCWHHSSARIIPAATWTCVEWKFDGASNGMQMWLDGAPADDLTIAGHGDGCVNAANDFTWTAPTFASIDLGWESYQQDDPRTAYIDDVVLSTTKIGCP
jgi:hypothetical protein